MISMKRSFPSILGATSRVPVSSSSSAIVLRRVMPRLVCDLSLPLNIMDIFTLSPWARNF